MIEAILCLWSISIIMSGVLKFWVVTVGIVDHIQLESDQTIEIANTWPWIISDIWVFLLSLVVWYVIIYQKRT